MKKRGRPPGSQNRGRTKTGKTAVAVYFSAEEMKLIDDFARENCRSRPGQITYFVLCSLGLRPRGDANAE